MRWIILLVSLGFYFLPSCFGRNVFHDMKELQCYALHVHCPHNETTTISTPPEPVTESMPIMDIERNPETSRSSHSSRHGLRPKKICFFFKVVERVLYEANEFIIKEKSARMKRQYVQLMITLMKASTYFANAHSMADSITRAANETKSKLDSVPDHVLMTKLVFTGFNVINEKLEPVTQALSKACKFCDGRIYWLCGRQIAAASKVMENETKAIIGFAEYLEQFQYGDEDPTYGFLHSLNNVEGMIAAVRVIARVLISKDRDDGIIQAEYVDQMLSL